MAGARTLPASIRAPIVEAMSILSPLERFLAEPARVEAEARELDRDRAGAPRTSAAPPLHRCRVCGLESTDRSHCPDCLADTMVLATSKPPR